ncbi:MAG: hypothetical protein WBL52_01115 [Bacillota bacterium]|nr:hypothetical protein [Candidatus Fermentithermobacillaceae bacterium]HOP70465.1 hypothetical protein [Bacillota bacterium]HPT34979.1 hypothetical protein [Bacillota bacterium]
MRLRSRNRRHRWVSLALGACGLAILIMALPSWMLWALLGTLLLAGGTVMYLTNK